MKTILILLFLCLTLSAMAQDYDDKSHVCTRQVLLMSHTSAFGFTAQDIYPFSGEGYSREQAQAELETHYHTGKEACHKKAKLEKNFSWCFSTWIFCSEKSSFI